MDDPRVTRLQVITRAHNLFHRTDAVGRCVTPTRHSPTTTIPSSSIFCRSTADSAGHRHGSRVCHDPKDPAEIRQGEFWMVRDKNAFLRNITLRKHNFSLPTFRFTSKPCQHFSVSARAPPAATVTRASLTFPPLEHLRYAFVAPAVWFMAGNDLRESDKV